MIFGEIFSPTDLAVVVIVVLLLFGGKKLPQLARSLGTASSEFKKGLEETQKSDHQSSDVKNETNSTPKDQ